MANDFRRLKEEAVIEEVVDYLGIEAHVKGSAKFILCPLPGHNDKHPTNCYFKKGWSNVYCSACGRAIQAIDLIMHTKFCSYGEAADILWEIEGCPDWYRDETWRKQNKNNVKIPFSVTGKEAEIIGIHMPRNILSPVSYSDCRTFLSGDVPKGYAYDGREIDGYLLSKIERVTYKDFMSEDEFKGLVLSKCKETLDNYENVEDSLKKRGLKGPFFIEKKEIIAEVMKRAAA